MLDESFLINLCFWKSDLLFVAKFTCLFTCGWLPSVGMYSASICQCESQHGLQPPGLSHRFNPKA